MNSLDLVVARATDLFHDEYRRHFPAGGDEGDHDEAIRCGVEAVVFTTAPSDPPTSGELNARIIELEQTMTARELAQRLAISEKWERVHRRRALDAEAALHSIARGDWTRDGAIHVAQGALGSGS